MPPHATVNQGASAASQQQQRKQTKNVPVEPEQRNSAAKTSSTNAPITSANRTGTSSSNDNTSSNSKSKHHSSKHNDDSKNNSPHKNDDHKKRSSSTNVPRERLSSSMKSSSCRRLGASSGGSVVMPLSTSVATTTTHTSNSNSNTSSSNTSTRRHSCGSGSGEPSRRVVSGLPEQEVDFYDSPTVLSRLILHQKYESALRRLERASYEARTWVSAIRAPADVDDNATQKTSFTVHSQTEFSFRQLPLHMAVCELARVVDPVLRQQAELVIGKLVTLYPEACTKRDHQDRLPLHEALWNHASPSTIRCLLMAYPEAVDVKDRFGRTAMQIVKHRRGGKGSEQDREDIERALSRKPDFWKMARREVDLKLKHAVLPAADASVTSASVLADSLADEGDYTIATKQSAVTSQSRNSQEEPQHYRSGERVPLPSSKGAINRKKKPVAWDQLEQRAQQLEHLLAEHQEQTYHMTEELSRLKEIEAKYEQLTSSTQLAQQVVMLGQQNEVLTETVERLKRILLRNDLSEDELSQFTKPFEIAFENNARQARHQHSFSSRSSNRTGGTTISLLTGSDGHSRSSKTETTCSKDANTTPAVSNPTSSNSPVSPKKQHSSRKDIPSCISVDSSQPRKSHPTEKESTRRCSMDTSETHGTEKTPNTSSTAGTTTTEGDSNRMRKQDSQGTLSSKSSSSSSKQSATDDNKFSNSSSSSSCSSNKSDAWSDSTASSRDDAPKLPRRDKEREMIVHDNKKGQPEHFSSSASQGSSASSSVGRVSLTGQLVQETPVTTSTSSTKPLPLTAKALPSLPAPLPSLGPSQNMYYSPRQRARRSMGRSRDGRSMQTVNLDDDNNNSNNISNNNNADLGLLSSVVPLHSASVVLEVIPEQSVMIPTKESAEVARLRKEREFLQSMVKDLVRDLNRKRAKQQMMRTMTKSEDPTSSTNNNKEPSVSSTVHKSSSKSSSTDVFDVYRMSLTKPVDQSAIISKEVSKTSKAEEFWFFSAGKKSSPMVEQRKV